MSALNDAIKQPISLAHDLATKKIFKQFARKFDFVYFGHVSHQEDEHQLIRGVTSAARHVDNHYTVGTFRNYDATFVERQDTVTFPSKPSHTYRWVILQLDLKRGGLPHIFIEGSHHEEVFFANLFVKFAQFHNATNIFLQHDPLFTRHFKVFAAADAFTVAPHVLHYELTAMLAHHFRQFDYEVDDDRLLIYACNPSVVTLHLLQEQMRVGIWLAEQLDGRQAGM